MVEQLLRRAHDHHAGLAQLGANSTGASRARESVLGELELAPVGDEGVLVELTMSASSRAESLLHLGGSEPPSGTA